MMFEYIKAVRRGFRDQHGFKPTGGTDEDPTFSDIVDGYYPMTIDGKTDHVRVINGQVHCLQFAEAAVDAVNPV